MRQNLLRLLALLLCAGALTAAYYRTKSTATMSGVANNFLAALTTEQKAKATFAMNDAERVNWHFIPRERKGLPLREMQPFQQALAHAFLNAGLSTRGAIKASTIMSLEEILKIQEKDTRGRRDAGGYFFTVFGEPSDSSTWGWRVEGHHLALNFTVVKGQTVAVSPAFWGANPAEVKDGPRKGLRALDRQEDLARELLLSLDAKQKPIAVIDPIAPKDILTSNSRKVDPQAPKGIAAAKLNKKQQELLMALIEEYTGNWPEDLGNARLETARKGLDKTYFAWAGGPDRGQGHYYIVQAPAFLIEYDNTQNNANHIHSVWRDFKGDFGDDLLASHYQQMHLARR
jgi:hypothetical protein